MESDELSSIPEGIDSDTEPLSAKHIGSARSTFKEVVIPLSSFKMPVSRSRTLPASQSPSNGSALSSVRDQSSEYDTPGTSTAVTPAESLGKPTSLAELARNTGRDNIMQRASQMGVPRKRKHEDTLGDALLAQALQEEEFQEQPPIRGIVRRRRITTVEASDDEDLDLIAMDEEDLRWTVPESSKRPRVGGQSSLPTRAARESAQKSIADKMSRSIMDTDSDDSGLSAYGSDEDLEEFNGSELSEDDMSVADLTAPDIPSMSTGLDHQATVPATRNSTRRRSTRPTRRRNAHLSRVRFFAY